MEIEEIKVFRPPCNFSTELVSARVIVDKELSELLPYVKGAVAGAKYFPKGPFLKFLFKGHPVTMEGNCIAIGGFTDDTKARERATELVELLNDIEARKDSIAPDVTPYKAPTVMEIYKLLPRKSSCDKCGYPSCMAFATALVKEETSLDRCLLIAKGGDTFLRLKDILGC